LTWGLTTMSEDNSQEEDKKVLANRARSLRWYYKHLEKNRIAGKERAKKRRLEHPEESREIKRAFYWKHLEAERERSRLWQSAHPEQRKENSHRYYEKNREAVKARGPLRIKYKDKRVYLEKIPRTGVCRLCGAKVGIDCQRTHIHHAKYDDSDVIKNTVEVCPACHNRITFNWDKRKKRLT
jgi:hypothetical protein